MKVETEEDEKTQMNPSSLASVEYKNTGNAKFQEKNYPEALENYEKALHMAPANDYCLRHSICSNISLCHFHLRKYFEALQYINVCHDYITSKRLPTEDVKLKIFCRKATILAKMKRFSEALDVLNEASSKFSTKDDNATITKLLQSISAHLEKKSQRKMKSFDLYSDKSIPIDENEVLLDKIKHLVKNCDFYTSQETAYGRLSTPAGFRNELYGNKSVTQVTESMPKSLQELLTSSFFKPMILSFIPVVKTEADVKFEKIKKEGIEAGDALPENAEVNLRNQILLESFAYQCRLMMLKFVKEKMKEAVRIEENLAKFEMDQDLFDRPILMDQIPKSLANDFKTSKVLLKRDFLVDDEGHWRDLLTREVEEVLEKSKKSLNRYLNENGWEIKELKVEIQEENMTFLKEVAMQMGFLPYELNDKIHSLKLCRQPASQIWLRSISKSGFNEQENKAVEGNYIEERNEEIVLMVLLFILPGEATLKISWIEQDGREQDRDIAHDTLIILKTKHLGFKIAEAKFPEEEKTASILVLQSYFFGTEG